MEIRNYFPKHQGKLVLLQRYKYSIKTPCDAPKVEVKNTEDA